MESSSNAAEGDSFPPQQQTRSATVLSREGCCHSYGKTAATAAPSRLQPKQQQGPRQQQSEQEELPTEKQPATDGQGEQRWLGNEKQRRGKGEQHQGRQVQEDRLQQHLLQGQHQRQSEEEEKRLRCTEKQQQQQRIPWGEEQQRWRETEQQRPERSQQHPAIRKKQQHQQVEQPQACRRSCSSSSSSVVGGNRSSVVEDSSSNVMGGSSSSGVMGGSHSSVTGDSSSIIESRCSSRRTRRDSNSYICSREATDRGPLLSSARAATGNDFSDMLLGADTFSGAAAFRQDTLLLQLQSRVSVAATSDRSVSLDSSSAAPFAAAPTAVAHRQRGYTSSRSSHSDVRCFAFCSPRERPSPKLPHRQHQEPQQAQQQQHQQQQRQQPPQQQHWQKRRTFQQQQQHRHQQQLQHTRQQQTQQRPEQQPGKLEQEQQQGRHEQRQHERQEKQQGRQDKALRWVPRRAARTEGQELRALCRPLLEDVLKTTAPRAVFVDTADVSRAGPTASLFSSDSSPICSLPQPSSPAAAAAAGSCLSSPPSCSTFSSFSSAFPASRCLAASAAPPQLSPPSLSPSRCCVSPQPAPVRSPASSGHVDEEASLAVSQGAAEFQMCVSLASPSPYSSLGFPAAEEDEVGRVPDTSSSPAACEADAVSPSAAAAALYSPRIQEVSSRTRAPPLQDLAAAPVAPFPPSAAALRPSSASATAAALLAPACTSESPNSPVAVVYHSAAAVAAPGAAAASLAAVPTTSSSPSSAAVRGVDVAAGFVSARVLAAGRVHTAAAAGPAVAAVPPAADPLRPTRDAEQGRGGIRSITRVASSTRPSSTFCCSHPQQEKDLSPSLHSNVDKDIQRHDSAAAAEVASFAAVAANAAVRHAAAAGHAVEPRRATPATAHGAPSSGTAAEAAADTAAADTAAAFVNIATGGAAADPAAFGETRSTVGGAERFEEATGEASAAGGGRRCCCCCCSGSAGVFACMGLLVPPSWVAAKLPLPHWLGLAVACVLLVPPQLPLLLLQLLAGLLLQLLHLVLAPPLPPYFSWKIFRAFLGPGWLVAMAYLDPGNLEGDLQAGSRRSALTDALRASGDAAAASFPSPAAASFPSPAAASFPSPAAASFPSPAAGSFPSPAAASFPSPAAASFPSPAAASFPPPAAASFTSPAAPLAGRAAAAASSSPSSSTVQAVTAVAPSDAGAALDATAAAQQWPAPLLHPSPHQQRHYVKQPQLQQVAGSGGYEFLWVLLWGHAAGGVFQILAARLGNATGLDLATLCRRQLGKRMAAVLWLLTEFAIIGSDVQATLGCAVALKLLVGAPVWLGVLGTLVGCLTLLWFNADRTVQLENCFGACIALMALAFLYTAAVSKPSLSQVVQGLLLPAFPPIRSEDAVNVLGLLGGILMPHNVFLHSALVLTRDVSRCSPAAVAEANYYFSVETALALLISLILNCSVLCAFASPLISTPTGSPLTFETAPKALESAFGKEAVYIWAAGLLAAGQNAAIAGTYAGQFVMQGLLNLQFSRPVRLAITRLVTVIPLAALAYADQAVVDSVCRLVNVSQAFLLPFTLIPLVGLNSCPQVMGMFRLCGWRLCTVWLLAGAITAASALVAFTQFDALNPTPQLWVVFLLLVSLYVLLLAALHRQRRPDTSCVYLLARERTGETAARHIGEEAASAAHFPKSCCQTPSGTHETTPLCYSSLSCVTQLPRSSSSCSSSSNAMCDVPGSLGPDASAYHAAAPEGVEICGAVPNAAEDVHALIMPESLVHIPGRQEDFPDVPVV